MSASDSQARRILGQRADDHREPTWKTRPRTATERQAAAMLADATGGADEPDKRSATERQVAALRGDRRE
jgi:hypothetical protein